MKKLLTLIALLVLAALPLGWSLNKAIDAPASLSIVSPQGGYLIESVGVGGLLSPTGGLAYLRIIDRQDPTRVFRSPLYLRQVVDMRVHEDDQSLGVTWIEFDKREQRFILSVPQWRPDWRNFFLGNTPYEVIPNG